jgi:hypothetical protein
MHEVDCFCDTVVADDCRCPPEITGNSLQELLDFSFKKEVKSFLLRRDDIVGYFISAVDVRIESLRGAALPK